MLNIFCHLRKSADVHLINDQLIHGNLWLPLFSPEKIISHHSGPISFFIHLFAPYTLACHCLCIGVKEYVVLIKEKALFPVPDTAQPVSILKFSDIQTEHHHGVHVTDLKMLRKPENRIRFLLCPVKKQQLTERRTL